MAQLEKEYDGEVSEYLEFFTPEPATPLPRNDVTELETPGEDNMVITLFPLSFTFRGQLQGDDEGRFHIDRLFESVDSSSEGHVEIDMENSISDY